MSRIIPAAVAAALGFCWLSQADAQIEGIKAHGLHGQGAYQGGYFVGQGYSKSHGRHRHHSFVNPGFYSANSYNSFHRPTNLPYFAEFPPVYYSQEIVRRPYGVSPYAAPPGIVPAEYELRFASKPALHIVNPYGQPGVHPPQIHPPDVIHPHTDDDDKASDSAPKLEPQNQGWEIVPRKDRDEKDTNKDA